MDENILRILTENQNKSFIQRILKPNEYPTLDNKDGTHSTHSMTWGETDGKFVVYPTVLYNDKKKLTRHDFKSAWENVRETGNFVEFDTAEEADFFSREYKQYWDK